jgi:molybdate transport system regulatory protein
MLPTDLGAVAHVCFERQGAVLLGEREAALLDAIEGSHSIKEAARATGMSYRTAWARIQAMERALGTPVVLSRAGGTGGGTTTLTEDTRTLLRLFTNLHRRVTAHVTHEFQSAVTPTH